MFGILKRRNHTYRLDDIRDNTIKLSIIYGEHFIFKGIDYVYSNVSYYNNTWYKYVWYYDILCPRRPR